MESGGGLPEPSSRFPMVSRRLVPYPALHSLGSVPVRPACPRTAGPVRPWHQAESPPAAPGRIMATDIQVRGPGSGVGPFNANGPEMPPEVPPGPHSGRISQNMGASVRVNAGRTPSAPRIRLATKRTSARALSRTGQRAVGRQRGGKWAR